MIVPTDAAAMPTTIINETVVLKYRGNVVFNMCGQMFSVGKNAKKTTVNIGKITSPVIRNAHIVQPFAPMLAVYCFDKTLGEDCIWFPIALDV